jgi:hypothetical protein
LEKEEMLFFITLILAEVRDNKCIDALTNLKSHPNKGIRGIVKDALSKV